MVGLLLRLLELNRIFDEKCRLLFSILQSSESLETSGIINRAIFSPPLYKSESYYYRFQKSIYLNDGSGKRCNNCVKHLFKFSETSDAMHVESIEALAGNLKRREISAGWNGARRLYGCDRMFTY